MPQIQNINQKCKAGMGNAISAPSPRGRLIALGIYALGSVLRCIPTYLQFVLVSLLCNVTQSGQGSGICCRVASAARLLYTIHLVCSSCRRPAPPLHNPAAMPPTEPMGEDKPGSISTQVVCLCDTAFHRPSRMPPQTFKDSCMYAIQSRGSS